MKLRDEDALEYHAAAPAGKIAIRATKPCLTQRDLSLEDEFLIAPLAGTRDGP